MWAVPRSLCPDLTIYFLWHWQIFQISSFPLLTKSINFSPSPHQRILLLFTLQKPLGKPFYFDGMISLNYAEPQFWVMWTLICYLPLFQYRKGFTSQEQLDRSFIVNALIIFFVRINFLHIFQDVMRYKHSVMRMEWEKTTCLMFMMFFFLIHRQGQAYSLFWWKDRSMR